MDFVTALVDLQKACGVDELKMSDYGITPEEFPKFVDNARSTMGILFKLDRLKLTDEDLGENLHRILSVNQLGRICTPGKNRPLPPQLCAAEGAVFGYSGRGTRSSIPRVARTAWARATPS